MNLRTVLFVVAAMAVTALATWLSRELEFSRQADEQARRHVVDYFFNRFTTVTMDEQGVPTYRLTAERLEHYGDTDTMELTRPTLVLHQPDGSDWHARAERGWVGRNGNLVRLSGNVVLVQPGKGDREPLRLTTEQLRIRPKKDYADTDEPVEITSHYSRTTAVGMQAFLREDRVILLSEVRGIHEPPAR